MAARCSKGGYCSSECNAFVNNTGYFSETIAGSNISLISPCSTHTAIDNLIPTYHSILVLSVDPVCLGSLITGVCLAFSPGSVVSVLSETLVVVAVDADV